MQFVSGIRGALVVFLVSVLCAQLAQASDEQELRRQFSPSRTSLCAALLLTRPRTPAQRGELQYYLNGLNAAILEHLKQVNQGPTSRLERLKKYAYEYSPGVLLGKLMSSVFGQQDRTQPNDSSVSVVFEEPLNLKYRPSTEILIESLVGRIAQLDADFTKTQADQISFGFEVRGTEAIAAYLNQTLRTAETYEAKVQPQLYRNRTGFRAHDFIFPGMMAGFHGWYLAYIGQVSIKALSQGDYFGAALLAGIGVYWAHHFTQPTIRNLYYRLRATTSAKWRAEYDLQYSHFILNHKVAYFDQIMRLSQQEYLPDAFVYNGFQVHMPESFLRELNHAYDDNRDVAYEDLLSAAVRDRRTLFEAIDDAKNGRYVNDPLKTVLFDQIFFFDQQTREPVLVSFVRVKKDAVPRPRKKKKQEEQKRVEEYSGGWQPEGAR